MSKDIISSLEFLNVITLAKSISPRVAFSVNLDPATTDLKFKFENELQVHNFRHGLEEIDVDISRMNIDFA